MQYAESEFGIIYPAACFFFVFFAVSYLPCPTYRVCLVHALFPLYSRQAVELNY